MSKTRKSLVSLRKKAFQSQRGLCFYCRQPMWMSSAESHAKEFGITLSKAKLMRCTGEHLVSHGEGGVANSSNIVAACWYCNARRHRRKLPPSPGRFATYVSRRLKGGRWHGLKLTG